MHAFISPVTPLVLALAPVLLMPGAVVWYWFIPLPARRKLMASHVSGVTTAQADSFKLDDKPFVYGAGLDGSRLSMKVFQTCCSMAHQQTGEDDVVTVIHVLVDETAATHRESDSLKSVLELEAERSKVKLEYCTEPKLASESICNALMRKAKELKLDFVALGVYGNLEENKSLDMNKFLLEPQANNHQHMERHHGGHGRTVSDAVLLLDNQSLVMVKTTSYDLEKVCTWAMATDHSHHSQAAFALLTRRMAKPGDKVLVVHVHGQAKDEYVLRDILEVYDSAIQKSQVDGSVTALEGSGSINPGEMIVDFCKEHEADFVVVGIAGSGRAPRMGSVSEYITRMARCSVVVIKDPRDFSSHM